MARYVIDGPIPAPPLYRLLDVATVVEDTNEHWMLGGEVWSYPPQVPSTHDGCSSGTFRSKADGGPIPTPEFDAFTVYLSASCTARGIGNDDAEYRRRAVAAFTATESQAVERELARGGSLPLNPFLADLNMTVPAAGAQTPVTALAYLEDAIGESGRAGLIHLTPAITTALAAGNHLQVRSGVLETLRGTRVVVGTGYQDVQPVGYAVPAAGTAWAFATGPVQIRRTEAFVLPETIREALDRENNDVTFYAERHYLVDWDTAVQAGVLVDWST